MKFVTDWVENMKGKQAGYYLILWQNNILDWYKMKAFPDDNYNAARITKFVFDRVENIVEKWENAGNSIFYFLHL